MNNNFTKDTAKEIANNFGTSSFKFKVLKQPSFLTEINNTKNKIMFHGKIFYVYDVLEDLDYKTQNSLTEFKETRFVEYAMMKKSIEELQEKLLISSKSRKLHDDNVLKLLVNFAIMEVIAMCSQNNITDDLKLFSIRTLWHDKVNFFSMPKEDKEFISQMLFFDYLPDQTQLQITATSDDKPLSIVEDFRIKPNHERFL